MSNEQCANPWHLLTVHTYLEVHSHSVAAALEYRVNVSSRSSGVVKVIIEGSTRAGELLLLWHDAFAVGGSILILSIPATIDKIYKGMTICLGKIKITTIHIYIIRDVQTLL